MQVRIFHEKSIACQSITFVHIKEHSGNNVGSYLSALIDVLMLKKVVVDPMKN
jgi:hypothetical protein